MKSIVRVADKSIHFNQVIFKFNNIIIQRLNSLGRGRSNKLNTQIADWDIITLNIFISIISESDVQRYDLKINNIEILEKMVSSEERILDIIELIIEYDILTASDTTLRARTEMITEALNNNLTTIFKDRASSSELSDVPEDFKSITVNNNNNIKKPQSKERKRNKYYYTKNITQDFQSSIANNKMDIIKYIQLFT